MKAVLMEKEVWDVVMKELANPPATGWETEPTVPPTAGWRAKSMKAYNMTVLSIDNSHIVHVKKCKTGKEAWDALKSLHQQSTLVVRIQVMEMEASLDDGVAVNIIFGSLSSKYDNIISAVKAWDDKKLTFQAIKRKLLKEWEKRHGEKETHESNAMAANTGSRYGIKRSYQQRYNGGTSREGFLCHFCRNRVISTASAMTYG
jgi:gag-polypeptide of LTR copia-type